MHKAPTVDYPVGRSRFQAIALLVLLSGVCVVDGLWFFQSNRLDWRHGLGVAVTLAAIAVALRAWRVAPKGTLDWDGQSWWWTSNGTRASGVVTPHLDLQVILLLGFVEHGRGRRWFWLTRSSAPMRWTALRRAVHAPRATDADGNGDDGRPGMARSCHGGTMPS